MKSSFTAILSILLLFFALLFSTSAASFNFNPDPLPAISILTSKKNAPNGCSDDKIRFIEAVYQRISTQTLKLDDVMYRLHYTEPERKYIGHNLPKRNQAIKTRLQTLASIFKNIQVFDEPQAPRPDVIQVFCPKDNPGATDVFLSLIPKSENIIPEGKNIPFNIEMLYFGPDFFGGSSNLEDPKTAISESLQADINKYQEIKENHPDPLESGLILQNHVFKLNKLAQASKILIGEMAHQVPQHLTYVGADNPLAWAGLSFLVDADYERFAAKPKKYSRLPFFVDADYDRFSAKLRKADPQAKPHSTPDSHKSPSSHKEKVHSQMSPSSAKSGSRLAKPSSLNVIAEDDEHSSSISGLPISGSGTSGSISGLPVSGLGTSGPTLAKPHSTSDSPGRAHGGHSANSHKPPSSFKEPQMLSSSRLTKPLEGIPEDEVAEHSSTWIHDSSSISGLPISEPGTSGSISDLPVSEPGTSGSISGSSVSGSSISGPRTLSGRLKCLTRTCLNLVRTKPKLQKRRLNSTDFA